MSTEPIPLARVSAFVPFVEFLENIEAPAERFLEEVKLAPHLLEQPEELLPFLQGCKFLERAARSEGIEHLGLLVGQQTAIGRLGAFGRLIRNAASLYEAIDLAIRTVALYNSGERLWLTLRGNQALLCHAYRFEHAVGQRHGDLFTLTLMINVVRLAAGPQWKPDEVRLPVCEGRRRKDYEALLEAAITCERDVYAIVFDRQLLMAPLRSVGHRQSAYGDDYRILQASPLATDFAGSVRQAIAALVRVGYPDIGLVAELVGLSVRTFQRRLSAEATSYSHLVEQARFDVAKRLLIQDRVRLVDVAYELGYTDAANFTRAFKRWTGVAPREFRRDAGRSLGSEPPSDNNEPALRPEDTAQAGSDLR